MQEYLTINHLKTKDLIRIFSKIQVSETRFYNGEPCWEWTAYKTPQGYGYVAYCGKYPSIHRLMYAWLVAPLPPGRDFGEIDHRCDNESCCNPVHLKFVTGWENFIRSESIQAQNARKTHCDWGHEFTDTNTRITKQGSRICRECKRIKESHRTRARRASDPTWAENERMRRRQYQSMRFATDPGWRERRRASYRRTMERKQVSDALPPPETQE